MTKNIQTKVLNDSSPSPFTRIYSGVSGSKIVTGTEDPTIYHITVLFDNLFTGHMGVLE